MRPGSSFKPLVPMSWLQASPPRAASTQSRPFSRANALLALQGADAVDWRVAGEHALS